MPVAAPEFKENIKIAKGVQEITQVLKAVAGNPATIKAKKDEEKKLVKEHKKVLSQWFEVLDEQQEQLEKSKIRTGAMFSFMGIQAKKYFAETESQAITWRGLAKSLGQGVKNWFDTAKKQNTMLGFTLRLGTSLWKGVNDHIIGTVKNVFGRIGNALSEVLGELSVVFDFIKGIFMGVFNFIKDTFMGFFRVPPPHDRRRNRLLEKIVGFMRRAEKRDLLQAPMERPGLFGALALLTAAILGGIIRKFLLPFELTFGKIFQALRLKTALSTMKNFFTGKFPFLGKLFARLGVWWDKIIKAFKWVGTKIPFLSKLFGALKFGFKFLGWPLQIILSVIDFIRGFAKAEGTIGERVVAGIKFALEQFFELPVKVLGWIIEKILGLFGIEVTGVADKIMAVLKGWWEILFGWLTPIIGFFEGFFKTKGGFIDRIIGGINGFIEGWHKMIDSILAVFPESVQKMIIGFFTTLGEWFGILVDKFKGILSWFGIEFDEGAGAGAGGAPVTTTAPASDFMQATQAEAAKIEAERQAAWGGVEKAIKEQTEKQIASDEKLSKEQGDNIAVAMANPVQTAPAKDTEKQLPSEELFSFAMGNSNMGF